jgi:hypothetical protein
MTRQSVGERMLHSSEAWAEASERSEAPKVSGNLMMDRTELTSIGQNVKGDDGKG